MIVNTPMNLGQMLSETFKVWRQQFIPLAIVMMIALFPLMFFNTIIAYKYPQFHTETASITTLTPLLNLTYFFILALSFLLQMTATAYAYIVASKACRGETFSWDDALTILKKRWLVFFGTQFFIGFLTMLGTFLLVIPGILVMINYSLTFPVMFAEANDGQYISRNSRKRSWKLVKGFRWRILGYGLVLLFLVSIVSVLEVIFYLIFSLSFKLSLSSILTYSWWPIFSTWLYLDIKGRKESEELIPADIEVSSST